MSITSSSTNSSSTTSSSTTSSSTLLSNENGSKWNIAIVGATGQVGSALVELLAKQKIAIDQLYLVGSDNSAGDIVRFAGKNLTVIQSQDMDFTQCQFAFFVAGREVTEQYAQVAAQAGCVVIDASGYFAEQENIPLVVPNVNNSAFADYRNENIIAVANPIVCQLLLTVTAVTDPTLLTNLHAMNFIPVSLYGKKGVNELAGQSARLLNGMPIDNDLFNKQLAFNLLPTDHKLTDNLFNEKLLVEQIYKVLNNYQLPVSLDSVTVPVFYGLAQSVNISSSLPIEFDNHRFAELDITLQEQDLPTPVTETTNSDESNLQDELSHDGVVKIKMANLRHSYGNFEQVQFWSVADNIRYLGAFMLIETLEILLNDYL
ncbi:aspartate-semialdehyde dehydrogenase [Orbaceae bacterium ESL0721]|nr:aspartate-semialdehyde dehydrogenase [Orbaceae bacterium ESL0721]